jgi:hypothetical protein
MQMKLSILNQSPSSSHSEPLLPVEVGCSPASETSLPLLENLVTIHVCISLKHISFP